MSPIHNIVRVLIITKGHLCVCFDPRSNRYVYLPGGHIENNETAEECINREILEETGLTLKNLRLRGILEHIFDRPQPCHTHEFNFIFTGDFENCTFPIMPPALEKTVAFKWISLNNLSGILPEALETLIPIWVKKPMDISFYTCAKMRKK